MAQRATSLGPKPSLLVFKFVFLSLRLIENACFSPPPPPKKGILFICLCRPLFIFCPFLASPFFTVSFFVCLLSFSFFLPSCLSCQFLGFAFCFCLLFLSRCSFVFVVLLVVLFCLESLYYIFFGFASCFVFVVVVVVLVFALIFVVFLFYFWPPITKISQNMEIPKTPRMKNAEKKRHSDKSN